MRADQSLRTVDGTTKVDSGSYSYRSDRVVESIMVPYDFSVLSELQLNYALALAGSGNQACHLRLIHVVEPLPLWGMGATTSQLPTEDELADLRNDQLGSLLARLRRSGFRVSSSVHFGKPAPEIAASVLSLSTDLLVLGTRGEARLKRLLLGTVADHVVREAPCSILVLREEQRHFVATGDQGAAALHLRKILVPTDFSLRSFNSIRFAESFARQFGGKITLLHIVTLLDGLEIGSTPRYHVETLLKEMKRAAEEKLADVAARNLPEDLRGGIAVRVGMSTDEISRYARSGEFDLIVCATHGYAGLKHLLLGSTAEEIMRHAPCPVLIAKNKPPGGQTRQDDLLACEPKPTASHTGATPTEH